MGERRLSGAERERERERATTRDAPASEAQVQLCDGVPPLVPLLQRDLAPVGDECARGASAHRGGALRRCSAGGAFSAARGAAVLRRGARAAPSSARAISFDALGARRRERWQPLPGPNAPRLPLAAVRPGARYHTALRLAHPLSRAAAPQALVHSVTRGLCVELHLLRVDILCLGVHVGSVDGRCDLRARTRRRRRRGAVDCVSTASYARMRRPGRSDWRPRPGQHPRTIARSAGAPCQLNRGE